MLRIFILVLLTMGLSKSFAESPRPFKDMDLFNLEYAAEVRISPDGKQIVYVRRGFDIMTDRPRSSLWIIDVKSGAQEPLVSGEGSASSPRWSPDGKRIAYIARYKGKSQLHVKWLASGNTINVTHLTESPGNIVWSPDGNMIAFNQFVADAPLSIGKLPKAPKGANWAREADVIDKLLYRSDASGLSKPGVKHIFVVSADGGSPRRVTSEPYNHNSPVTWAKDNQSVYFSANYDEDWQRNSRNSEIYQLSILGGAPAKPLTTRKGPDMRPAVSPDGKQLLFLGKDDNPRYRVNDLYVTSLADFKPRLLTAEIDLGIRDAKWAADGRSIFVSYVEKSVTKVAEVGLDGRFTEKVSGLGGTAIGRPYSSGSFSLANNESIGFTMANAERPAEVGYFAKGKVRTLTGLNNNLLDVIEMGEVEEIWFESSHDKLPVQGWIVKPPGFDVNKQYPLILEIHGGPYTSYAGDFSAEVQLFAAAGYVVLYTNPRGSTSYGTAFTDEIYKAYPKNDYDDLISGVDEVISRGYIDEEQLFVTGGSGGGVLTTWIVGNTHRFKAAVAAKPVINWYSHTLTADIGSYFWKINFESLPWEEPLEYHRLSPISLVGNVETPTMLLTGEVDYRTPISESEQYYQALQIRGVDSMLVRIPETSHSITRRPSNLLRKAAYILGWFDRYRTPPR